MSHHIIHSEKPVKVSGALDEDRANSLQPTATVELGFVPAHNVDGFCGNNSAMNCAMHVGV